MAERGYSDFDLAISDLGEGRYRVRVLASPSGQAGGEFVLPFSELEMENFLLRIGRPRRGTRRLESPEAEAARSFGRRLCEEVFSGDIGVAWQRSLDTAERNDRGLRLRLHLGDAPELAEVPWEYMYLPTGDRHLVLSTWTPLVRYLDLPRAPRPLTVQPPLRLLAMISSPADYPALDTDAEWAKLDESLNSLEADGMVEVTRLEKATLQSLQRALRRTEYHVFHFMGHGGFDEQSSDGVLVLENDDGGSRRVTGRELGTILTDARSVRLAVLNSCEGARSSGADPFGGTAPTLVKGGIPAVVAMQFEISDEAAIVFAHELYLAIADGYPIDAAVAESRRAIFGAGNDVEWGTPVLYMRSDDGRLFDFEPQALDESPIKPFQETATPERGEAPPDDLEAAADEVVAPAPPVGAPAAPEEPPDGPETQAEIEDAQDGSEEVDPPAEDEPTEGSVDKGEIGTERPIVVDMPQRTLGDEIAAARATPWVGPEEGGASEQSEIADQLPIVALEEPAEPIDLSTTVEIELEDEPVPAPPAPSDSTPSPDATVENSIPTLLVGLVALSLVVLVALFVVTRGDEEAPDVLQVVDSATVVAVPKPDGLSIDGDLSDWSSVTTAYLLQNVVFEDGSGGRLGEDSSATIRVAYDDEGLYLAAEANDDRYVQANVGNQIWRGDAIDINLSTVPPDRASSTPDGDDFQITMTPANDAGDASHVWFKGGESGRFGGAETNRPIMVAGSPANPLDTYSVEAFIPWSVFELDGPPENDLAALFAVFDNDGEVAEGRNIQRTILGNVPGAVFQGPSTWGRLVLES